MIPLDFGLILSKTIALFLVLDPIGNAGPIATLISPFDPKTQRRILRREVLIALFLLLLFYGGGSVFFGVLEISQAAVEITGGIVFSIFAINILFPQLRGHAFMASETEPFIVPIAIPLIAGPSCLATVMLFSNDPVSPWVNLIGIFLAWLMAASLVLVAPYLVRLAGKVGLRVGEQIIGLICMFVAIKMLSNGIHTFWNSL